MSTTTSTDTAAKESSSESASPSQTQSQTTNFLIDAATGPDSVTSATVRNNARSAISGSDPKVLAQRFRNMGFINNSERDELLNLPADQQHEALRKIQNDAEHVRTIAQRAIHSGILSHAEHMALFHSANAAVDSNGKAPRYTLKERLERASKLEGLLDKVKQNTLTIDQARKEYSGSNTQVPAVVTKPPLTTVKVKEPEAVKVKEPEAVKVKEPDAVKVKEPETPKVKEPAKTTPVTTPTVVTPTKETKVAHPAPFQQIEGIKIYTRVKGDIYDAFVQGAGKKNPEALYLISHLPEATKFHSEITALVLSKDESLRKALAGRKIDFVFHPDLAKVALKEGEKPERGESFNGVSITEGDRKNPSSIKIFIKPDLLNNPARAYLLVAHELKHVAMGIEGTTLSTADEEKAVIASSIKILEKIFDETEDNNIRRGIVACIRAERYRANHLPKRYLKD